MKKSHILVITTDEQHRNTISCFDGIYPCKPNVKHISECADVFPNAIRPARSAYGQMIERGGRSYIISECENRVAILEGNYKLEVYRTGMRGRTHRKFYDLSVDPFKFFNRYDDPAYREIIAHLQSILNSQPYLNETIFRPMDGTDYWRNDGRGVGLSSQTADKL